MQNFCFCFPGRDGKNGTATISTNRQFDRERQKYYLIPIIMWDMRNTGRSESMTGTNTLTVTIADINDNDMRPGRQDMFVYNYKGGQIGQVVCACIPAHFNFYFQIETNSASYASTSSRLFDCLCPHLHSCCYLFVTFVKRERERERERKKEVEEVKE